MQLSLNSRKPGFALAALVLLMSIAFTAFSQSNQKLPDPAIYQKWLHSYEEDTNDLKIYRPSSYDFPLGWGRDGMTIKEDGSFILHDFAPNDTMVQKPGSWKLINETKLEVCFSSGNKKTLMIEIEKINYKILKIKRL